MYIVIICMGEDSKHCAEERILCLYCTLCNFIITQSRVWIWNLYKRHLQPRLWLSFMWSTGLSVLLNFLSSFQLASLPSLSSLHTAFVTFLLPFASPTNKMKWATVLVSHSLAFIYSKRTWYYDEPFLNWHTGVDDKLMVDQWRWYNIIMWP